MASPEVELARHLSEDQKNYEVPTDEIAKHGDEKRGKNESTSSLGHDADDEKITWRYLTFETELPSPAFLSETTPNEGESQSTNPPPPCPNLKKYTSPFLWSESRKSVLVYISCVATMFTACEWTSSRQHLASPVRSSRISRNIHPQLFSGSLDGSHFSWELSRFNDSRERARICTTRVTAS